jgi:hypothetical protein
VPCFKLNKDNGFELLYFTLGQIVVMNFCKTIVVLFLGIAAIVAGCKNKDRVVKNGIDPDWIYFDYNITAEEGNENVTCVFQYKAYDAEGKAINIEPGKVELDNQQLPSDSTRLSGFFYEVQKPVDSFAGKHTVVFNNPGNRKYKSEFEFSPFVLAEELPEKINRKPFIIYLKNFPATEKKVRLLLLDTVFSNTGFNDLVPVVDGKVHFDESILKTIKPGPINLELYMEQEVPLKQTTKAGGKISITYGLKREFELVE